MKSTTCPCATPGARKIRSMRLPSAPPSSNPSATAQPREPILRMLRRMNTTTTVTTIVRIQVYPEPIPSAAPSLRMNVRWSHLPRSSMVGSPSSFATAQILVAWSTRITRAASTATHRTRRFEETVARSGTAAEGAAEVPSAPPSDGSAGTGCWGEGVDGIGGKSAMSGRLPTIR
ncbi:hypothetical protein D3C74_379980 [compost metagenome]